MKSLQIKNNLIIVLGPTAAGKTRFAAALAFHIDGEIISADSRQIYRKMNLGTGKDYSDYKVGNKLISYHLIDIHEPGYKYNVFEYQQDFIKVIHKIHEKKKIPILCGGSGMYIDAVTKGYKLISVPLNNELRKELKDKTLDELEKILAGYRRLHNRTDIDTKKRAIRAIEIEVYYANHPKEKTNYPELHPIYFGIFCSRENRRERITHRLHNRLQGGMIEEVKYLLDQGLTPESLIYYGLEYKYITLYLTGQMDYNTMVQKLNIAIHQFAKRQMTWFRKMEREGIIIHWIDSELPTNKKIKRAMDILSKPQ